MKAKQLPGISIVILITAGVVVSFVTRSTTTVDRRAQSNTCSQIFSVNNNDLTSLLGTTKYDLETGSQFAKTAGSKITETVGTSPVPAIETSKEVVKSFSSLKTSSSSLLEMAQVEDGKALPLGNFIKSTLTGENTGSASIDSSAWDTAAANFGILTDNIFGLFGTQAPQGLPASKIELSINNIPEYLKNVPDDAKPWLVLATGTTLAIIGSSTSKKASLKVTAANKTKSIQASSDAIDSLSDELGSLQSRMNSLEANGLNLDAKLNNATSKLTQKELDISKEKLKAADASLNLGREIELLKQKLKENDDKVISLDTELAEARVECHQLVKELEKSKGKKMAAKKKAKEKEARLKAEKEAKEKEAARIKAEKEAEEKVDARLKADVEAKEKEAARLNAEKEAKEKEEFRLKADKKVKEKNSDNDKKLPVSSSDEAESSTKKTVPKKKSPINKSVKKVSTAKQTAPPKKIAREVKIEELPTADDAPARNSTLKQKSRSNKKSVTKVKKDTIYLQNTAEMKDASPKDSINESDPFFASPKKVKDNVDLTTLSKSALSRKTVKQLREFLKSKEVPIMGDDGKPLKKNDLLEAVRSL